MARRFSLQEDNILLAQRERGETFDSIAKYLGRHVDTVQARWTSLKQPIHTFSQIGDRAARLCLGPNCRGTKKFESEHKGERICKSCRKSIESSGITTQFGSAV